MNPDALLPVTGVVAILLIVAAGFCLIVSASKLAARLFIVALCVVVAPFVIFAVLGSFRGALHEASAAMPLVWIFGALGFLALGAFAWFAIRLNSLHIFQRWLIPRFGPEVDGQVTGTYVVRLLDAAWVLLRLFVVIALVLVVVVALR